MKQPKRLMLFNIAARLHKTIRELCRDCTAREIMEWVEYFTPVPEPKKHKSPDPKYVRAIFEQHNRRIKNRGSKTR